MLQQSLFSGDQFGGRLAMGGGSYGGHPGGDFGLGSGGMRDLSGLSEVEFEEILNKNKALANNTINRSVADATSGNETYLTNFDKLYCGSYNNCVPSSVITGLMPSGSCFTNCTFPYNLSPIFVSPIATPTLPSYEFFSPIGLDFSNGMWAGSDPAPLKI